MISISEAYSQFEKTVQTHPDNFKNLPAFLLHSRMARDRAQAIAASLGQERLGFDSELAALAGLYHDVGRCFTTDKDAHTFHEISGARYLEERAVELGLVSEQLQADLLADLIRPHFLVYEQFTLGQPECEIWKPGLRDTNPEMLLPRTLGQQLIVYADLTVVGNGVVDFKTRLEDIKTRDRKSGSPRLQIVEAAEGRLYDLEREINAYLR